MAENLPEQNAAATGTPSQGATQQPTQTPADANQQQPTLTFDSFDEDQKKYLAGQGITKQEELTNEALLKVVNHARSSQQTLAERQAELDRLKNGGGTQNPTGPTSDGATGATGAQSNTQQPEHKGLDETNAFILAGTLTSQYPKLKEKLADGSFYAEMEAEGYPVAKLDGTPNLTNIQRYAQRATKELELEEKLAEANKPNQIPDANGNNAQAFDSNSSMNLQVARAIVLTDPTNPRAAEAQKFLQDNVGRK